MSLDGHLHFGIDVAEPPAGTAPPRRKEGGRGRGVAQEDGGRGGGRGAGRGGGYSASSDAAGGEYPVLDEALRSLQGQECDFVCLPLLSADEFEPFGSSEQILEVTKWCNMVVGKTSAWIDCDSSDHEAAARSRAAFTREIKYAAHCTLPSVLIPLPQKNSPNLARQIMASLLQSSYLGIWVRVPLHIAGENPDEAWLRWNSLRTLCHNHSRLSVVLEMTSTMPRPDILKRWAAEPVRGIMIDTSIFQLREDGCALPQQQYDFLMTLHMHKVQVIFTGKPHAQITRVGQDLRYYKSYVQKMRQTITLSPQQQYEAPYQDYLQAPLQPLMDNLESQTYEVFEKDPVKYARYEEAVFECLQDMKKQDKVPTDGPVTLMVVGAGRGPLVRSSIRASERAEVPLNVYAVEKNPNAIVTLHALSRQLGWEGKVTIVETDMRVWDAPVACDIMVSELLGSFGDNELSPECLDGAERFLKPGGTMIPQSYRAFIAPLQTHKLHTDVLGYGELSHIETAYVVKIHAGHLLAPAQQCWEYVHPKPPPPYPQANDRVSEMSFDIKENGLLHGFAGYFDSVLYGDVNISIHPIDYSRGMFSWFPIYFPIKTPVFLNAGTKLDCTFWRVVGKTKVWYEWCVAGPSPTPIHNPTGRSYWVGL
eukprot:TRINITY_DN3816_c0_g1_i1.p1 TRINITY_DN3816_c0_g1~~TRINITY_DN3816_c0_g1_i1.p1  ORF type:complete len:649 (+),score=214.30 TRINITY_DN3816_c0_g1_i1:113-2059(+)